MKTTLDIPEELLAEAMAASGARTKREAVVRALEEFSRRAKLRKLAARLGRSKTFMGFEELMALRARELPTRSHNHDCDWHLLPVGGGRARRVALR